MKPEFKDKAALVTAASEGLGYACALRLAQGGASVAICARRSAELEKAGKEITRMTGAEVYTRCADLTDSESLNSFVDGAYGRFGKIDILIGNSGHIPYGGLLELEENQWYGAFDLLLMSMVRLLRRVVPAMKKQGSGDIVLLASSSIREPPPQLLLSNVMRVGVAALAKTLSKEIAGSNIRVNLVNPGYFDTGRVRRRIDESVEKDGVERSTAARSVAGDIPMGRIGSAGELAELVAFVASRKAEFLTGAAINIDGGKTQSIF